MGWKYNVRYYGKWFYVTFSFSEEGKGLWTPTPRTTPDRKAMAEN